MTLEADLCRVVGESHVLVDPSVTASYETDWTRRFTGRARCVVRPADTEQVASVLRLCGRHGVAVVTQGGNTGLVGGAVPSGGELVLSTSRLRQIGPFDAESFPVTVGAGLTLAALRRTVRPVRLASGVTLAPRAAATGAGLVSAPARAAGFYFRGAAGQPLVRAGRRSVCCRPGGVAALVAVLAGHVPALAGGWGP